MPALQDQVHYTYSITEKHINEDHVTYGNMPGYIASEKVVLDLFSEKATVPA